ncbi:GntR family transcriptional regulator [Ammoniphilus sp. 3BR4]|uniref:GntR family transcriptional regulator n=1 Tax=Ammoniphilus sp. 3BR4 TaxID=3158265 RepID=UPI0034668D22
MNYPTKWLQGASLGEKISCELRLQIIKGSIYPGTVLSENQIAADFGTSRSPVREALKVLSNEGLIRLERMGATVLGLNERDIEELYDVRFLLESFALQRIVAHFDDTKAALYYQIIDKMELNAKYGDYIDFSYSDLLFHENIIKEANHFRILHMWDQIRHIVLTLLLVATEKRFLEKKEEILSLPAKHRALIEALCSKDVGYINRLVQEHFKDTKNTVINAYFSKD